MLISIITVVKNNKSQISHTLQSIQNQTYKNLELIVIDGCSDDGTDLIVKKYFKKFKLISKKDKSVYQAMNYAHKIAKGDFICFLHSGDIYLQNNTIKNIVKYANNYDLLSTNIIYFKDNLNISRIWNSDNNNFKNNYYRFAHTGFFYSKKVIKKFKYDASYKISGDSKYLLELSSKNLKHRHLNLTSVCMYGSGLSTNISNLLIRVSEDFRYLKIKYKYFFIWHYMKKIFSKISTIFIIKNSRYTELQNLLNKEVKKIEKNIFHNEKSVSKFFLKNQIIRLEEDVNKLINSNKNYVLSALNLAFLGSFVRGNIFVYKDLHFWPDGYLPLLINLKINKIKKIAGRNLIRNLKLKKNIKKIHVYGNLTYEQKKFLQNKFNLSVLFTSLPKSSSINLVPYFKKLKKDVLYLITLPTPKQEELAEILSVKNKHFKIILIGGALNILTGEEYEVPKKLEYVESLWRLRFDTIKRIKRLVSTFYYFSINQIFKIKTNFKFKFE